MKTIRLTSTDGTVVLLNVSSFVSLSQNGPTYTLTSTAGSCEITKETAKEVLAELEIKESLEEPVREEVLMSCGHSQKATLKNGEATRKWLNANGKCGPCQRAKAQ